MRTGSLADLVSTLLWRGAVERLARRSSPVTSREARPLTNDNVSQEALVHQSDHGQPMKELLHSWRRETLASTARHKGWRSANGPPDSVWCDGGQEPMEIPFLKSRFTSSAGPLLCSIFAASETSRRIQFGMNGDKAKHGQREAWPEAPRHSTGPSRLWSDPGTGSARGWLDQTGLRTT